MNWGGGDFQFLKSGSDEPCIQPIESSQLGPLAREKPASIAPAGFFSRFGGGGKSLAEPGPRTLAYLTSSIVLTSSLFIWTLWPSFSYS
ncbi:hypothetical protein GSJ18_14165 [Bordetella pertussis]|uniref:hypothetical protein n=1 Tax=Bordetella pertussis TaxID=520 RepID=UPI00138F0FB8|nr:hypothetical protein [Bordetella pertussis]QSY79631.1 hypothetical protein J3Q24_07125 [Bordetella pertussis]UEB59867.1 hypothetical protein LK428_09100 [Bordetella pertussis]ULX90897.1 hypothetical protein HRK15_14105 [Bordetella pertussis]ULY01557.1 hypothetical protein HRK12_14085 [Bordetella pertussis]ULY08945.1 hypothetical protein HRK11_14090 [Bordetella pertussis]